MVEERTISIWGEAMAVIKNYLQCTRLYIAFLCVAGSLTFSIPFLHAQTVQVEEAPGASSNQESDEEIKFTEAKVIQGTVLDLITKTPVENASVVVTMIHRDMKNKVYKVLSRSKQVTRDGGSYEYSITPEYLNNPHLCVYVDVRHDSYIDWQRVPPGISAALKHMLKAEEWNADPYDVLLTPAKPVVGRVVDEFGKPVVDAEVFGILRTALNEWPGSDDATTDKNGRFELKFKEEGEVCVFVRSDRHVMQAFFQGKKRSDLGDLQVTSGKPIRGYVLDVDGQPIPDVSLEIECLDSIEGLPAGFGTYRCQSNTNVDGKYELPPLPPGSYILRPMEREEITVAGQSVCSEFVDRPQLILPKNLTIAGGDDVNDFDIQAVNTVSIQAKFINSEGDPEKDPLGNYLSVFGKLGTQNVFDRKNQFRNFRFKKSEVPGTLVAEVPEGFNATLNFSSSGRLKLKTPGKNLEWCFLPSITLGPIDREYESLLVQQFKSTRLHVNVVDRDGERVAATLTLVYSNFNTGVTINGMRNDVSFWNLNGNTYDSEGVCPGEPFVLKVSSAGYKTAESTMTLNEGDDKTITLTLEKSDTADK